MDKMNIVLFYPGGFHLKSKEIELNQIELMAMMMSNKVYSEDKCCIIEEKVFHDKGDGEVELRVILGDCCY